MSLPLETSSQAASIPCPVCTSREARRAFEKSGYEFYRCGACGFLFTYPYPSDEVLSRWYNDRSRTPTENFFNKAASRRRRALIRSLKFLPYIFGRDVLDIGCGGGFMVGAFARLGAKASGLDISKGSIAYAQKHFPAGTYYCESFADFRARGLRFDFVFSSELLEHVPGPDELLATMAAVTKPGGRVYVSTPDAGHKAVPADIREWTDVAPPEHIQLFNRPSLEKLFRRYGFRLEKAYRKRTPAHSVIFRREA